MNRIAGGVAIALFCSIAIPVAVWAQDDFGDGPSDPEPTSAIITPEVEKSAASPTIPPTTFMNTAPVANAGVDQVVYGGALVVLDGTGSRDAEGAIVSYVWRQLSGPQVELFSDRTAYPSFSTKNVAATYIFQLTVRDRAGASAIDVVTISVRALPVTTATPLPVITSGSIITSTPLPQEPSSSLPPFITMLFIGLGSALVILLAIGAWAMRRGNAWSLVCTIQDATTRMPVSLVNVQVIDQGTTVVVGSFTTDVQGQIFAPLSPGVYILSCSRQGYAPVTKEGIVVPQVVETPISVSIDMLAITPQSVTPAV